MKKINLFLVATLFTTITCFASELKLKDGTVIKGNITGETEDTFTITITVPKSELDMSGIDYDAQTFKKPEKKVPAKEGNFEIVQGTSIPAPIDMTRMKNAIKKSLDAHGYKILSEEPGVITYMLYNKNWDVTVKFCYAPDEYWYEYVSSRNLDAKPEKNRIHRNYLKWISILEQDIVRFY